jgi:hypothetical protein
MAISETVLSSQHVGKHRTLDHPGVDFDDVVVGFGCMCCRQGDRD